MIVRNKQHPRTQRVGEEVLIDKSIQTKYPRRILFCTSPCSFYTLFLLRPALPAQHSRCPLDLRWHLFATSTVSILRSSRNRLFCFSTIRSFFRPLIDSNSHGTVKGKSRHLQRQEQCSEHSTRRRSKTQSKDKSKEVEHKKRTQTESQEGSGNRRCTLAIVFKRPIAQGWAPSISVGKLRSLKQRTGMVGRRVCLRAFRSD